MSLGIRHALTLGAALALWWPLSGASAQTSPDAATDVRMREIYQQILQDPADADLNVRYAELAITRGELRKALAAYERVLSQDPDNEAAKAGLRRVQRLLEPDYTRAVMTFGIRYESNPLRVPEPGDEAHDGNLFFQGQVTDERGFGTLRWRTKGQLFANWHFYQRDLDFGLVSVDTGPVLPLTEGWDAHLFAGGGYTWFDQRTFYFEANGGVSLQATEKTFLRSLTAQVRHDFISEKVSGRDAIIADITAQFVIEKLFFESDFTVFGPFYRYNGVFGSGRPTIDQRGDQFPLRFHQIGIRADQFTKLAERLTGNVNMTLEYRHYFEEVTFGTQNRRDIFVSPGAQLIVAGFPIEGMDVIFSYTFEWNTSNDGFENYTNHIAGIRLLWRL